jgi:4-aminobutyrate aminotransferase-like enzyme
MWPKGTTRMPGISASQAAVASRMKAGTLETGTETSFFTLAPSLYITEEEIDLGVALFEEALVRALAGRT